MAESEGAFASLSQCQVQGQPCTGMYAAVPATLGNGGRLFGNLEGLSFLLFPGLTAVAIGQVDLSTFGAAQSCITACVTC